MVKSSINSNLTAIGILLILLGMGGTYQFLSPGLGRALQNQQAEITTEARERADIIALQAANSKLGELGNKLKERGIYLAAVDRIIPRTEDIPSLYVQLDAIVGSATRISQAGYQVGIPTAVKKDVQIPVTVRGIGSYQAVKDYLAAFERNARPVNFTLVSLTPIAVGTVTPAKAPALENSGFTATPQIQVSLSASGYVWARGLSDAYSSGK